jgi:hypothetical protein
MMLDKIKIIAGLLWAKKKNDLNTIKMIRYNNKSIWFGR